MAFCQSCGKEIKPEAKFCTYCGRKTDNVSINFSEKSSLGKPCKMDIGLAVEQCFKKYFNFTGRASREEFWLFELFSIIVRGSAFAMDIVSFGAPSIMLFTVAILLFFPELAVIVRRLHDTNRSGWFYLLAFTIIGTIPLIIFWAQDSYTKTNRYGLKPNC